MLNPVQLASYDLIQSDARFLYTLTDIQKNAKRINSNYIMMSQPYIGIFTDGAEQWCRKLGLDAPQFTTAEKQYYIELRQSHKYYEMPYEEYKTKLMKEFHKSDKFFYEMRRLREKIFGYYNVGTDLCKGEFCGNTILGALYTPIDVFSSTEVGPWLRDLSVVSGELAAYFGCTDSQPYQYDDSIPVTYDDFHFYKHCPIKVKDEFGFTLFSVLCSINYAIEFVEKYFVEDIPQKFKFAYLQYYYLCDFMKDVNAQNGTSFNMDASMKDRSFRNCLAHYGLGQYMSAADLLPDDPLKGLTNKAFGLSYDSAKEIVRNELSALANQIKAVIL